MVDSRGASSGPHFTRNTRTDNVHFVGAGECEAEFGRGDSGLEQCDGVAGVAADGVDIEPVLEF